MSNGALNEKQTDILREVLDLQRQIEERKSLYARLDALILELVAGQFKSAEIDGMVLALKDNFAESNTGWTRSAVKRWEIEAISKDLAMKREARKAKGAG